MDSQSNMEIPVPVPGICAKYKPRTWKQNPYGIGKDLIIKQSTGRLDTEKIVCSYYIQIRNHCNLKVGVTYRHHDYSIAVVAIHPQLLTRRRHQQKRRSRGRNSGGRGKSAQGQITKSAEDSQWQNVYLSRKMPPSPTPNPLSLLRLNAYPHVWLLFFTVWIANYSKCWLTVTE